MRRIGSATRDVDSKRLPSGGAFSGSDNKRVRKNKVKKKKKKEEKKKRRGLRVTDLR